MIALVDAAHGFRQLEAMISSRSAPPPAGLWLDPAGARLLTNGKRIQSVVRCIGVGYRMGTGTTPLVVAERSLRRIRDR